MKKSLALGTICAYSLFFTPTSYANFEDEIVQNATHGPRSSTPALEGEAPFFSELDLSFDIPIEHDLDASNSSGSTESADSALPPSPTLSGHESPASLDGSFQAFFNSASMQDPHEVAPDYVHATVFGSWSQIEPILQSQGVVHGLGATAVYQEIGESWHALVSFMQQNRLDHLLSYQQVPRMIAVLFLRHLQASNPHFQSQILTSRTFVSMFVQHLQRYGIYLPEGHFIPAMIVQLLSVNLQAQGFQLHSLQPQELLNLIVHFFLQTQGIHVMPAFTAPTFLRHAFM